VAAVISEPARTMADVFLKCEVIKGQQPWFGEFDAGVREMLKTQGPNEESAGLVVVADLLALAQGRVSEPWFGDEPA